jgi:hypothetical protein
MEFLNVLAAAVGGFGVGAVWYTLLSRPWIAASGVTLGPDGRPANAGALPFVVGLGAMILAAGMMRHVLAGSGIATPGAGLVAGAGIGAFVVVPWLAMNYAFAQRRPALTLIDGGNAIAASAVMGLILTLF